MMRPGRAGLALILWLCGAPLIVVLAALFLIRGC
jgi:hypothetical protein